ncbi:hypothetical protein [Alistipes finegoldii]|uniref:hypothetical protein n=1 Tax=Alistipes finegoldii TaxID=214856 RepID=UPI003AB8C695
MKKTKEHIKRFLSTVRPASEKDECMIRVFFNKRKIKLSVVPRGADAERLDTITYEQLESWYNASRPTVGDVIRCTKRHCICLVTQERWDSFIVGATLTPGGELAFEERRFTDSDWIAPSEGDMVALQESLSSHGYAWNPMTGRIEGRTIPMLPRFVRLMVIGRQVGVGVFREVLPDNTLEMFCVKMGDGKIRYEHNLNLGNANGFSFFDAYDEHRAAVQDALGEEGYIWNAKRRRIEKNRARAKVGKKYFWINSYLAIKQSIEKDSQSDRLHFRRGNYFLQREVAERVRNRMLDLCKEEMLADDNC